MPNRYTAGLAYSGGSGSSRPRAMGLEYDIANPRSSRLFESLRAFGYDLSTAVADLIDNSISAQARNIWVDFMWAGQTSRVLVRDDGRGMSEARLVEAMTPGSESPQELRGEADLGRFGLGMKTASISQCRCLTVITKEQGGPVVWRRWDLDYIAREGNGEWRLLKGDSLLSQADRDLLSGMDSGTVVMWDRLDHLAGEANEDDETKQRHFRERIDAVKLHLAMTFHRFLSGKGAIRLHLNGRRIEPWDPFLEGHPALDPLSMEQLFLNDDRIQVRPFVLPHHSKLTPQQHSWAAGPKGWNEHQGFYIYRKNRLLVAGDWLGLGMQKEEHCKLARIAVDIPGSTDLLWQLDVKKSKAIPPPELQPDLRRIARATRNKAANVYRHRGRVLQRQNSRDDVFLWSHVKRHGKTSYKISREHPLVKKALETTTDRATLSNLLRMVEQTVPAPLIVLQNSEAPDSLAVPFEDDVNGMQEAMTITYKTMIEQGKTPREAAEYLLVMEPFNLHPDLIAAFLEEISPLGSRASTDRMPT